jgi:hypothetical protein
MQKVTAVSSGQLATSVLIDPLLFRGETTHAKPKTNLLLIDPIRSGTKMASYCGLEFPFMTHTGLSRSTSCRDLTHPRHAPVMLLYNPTFEIPFRLSQIPAVIQTKIGVVPSLG